MFNAMESVWLTSALRAPKPLFEMAGAVSIGFRKSSGVSLDAESQPSNQGTSTARLSAPCLLTDNSVRMRTMRVRPHHRAALGASGVLRFKRWIVGITLGTAAIKRVLIDCVEGCVPSETFDKIGVGDERLTKRDEIGIAGG